jgi:hypothetical protein
MANVAVQRDLFQPILDMIDDLRPRAPTTHWRQKTAERSRRQAKYALTVAKSARMQFWGVA